MDESNRHEFREKIHVRFIARKMTRSVTFHIPSTR